MITKAVVPVAGKGSRLHPLTSAVPKALFPLVDSLGRCRPVIHWICAEAMSAGVTELAVVVSPAQEGLLERYFNAAANAPPALPRVIELVVQKEPLGFGHAVACAKRFVGKDNFLLMLGDHVYRPAPSAPPCAAQVIAAFDQLSKLQIADCRLLSPRNPYGQIGKRRDSEEKRPGDSSPFNMQSAICNMQSGTGPVAMVGVQPAPAGELDRVGVARGAPLRGGIYRCADFVEKPTPAVAKSRLATPGLTHGRYLAHCGLYAFTPEIFGCLAEIAADMRENRGLRPISSAKSVSVPDFSGEVELAAAQSLLLARRPNDYYLCRIRGQAYDTGTPETYARTAKAFFLK